MSFVERLLVPAPKSSASTSAVRRPRVAASSAAPVPVAPPACQVDGTTHRCVRRTPPRGGFRCAPRRAAHANGHAPPMTNTSKVPRRSTASWSLRPAGCAAGSVQGHAVGAAAAEVAGHVPEVADTTTAAAPPPAASSSKPRRAAIAPPAHAPGSSRAAATCHGARRGGGRLKRLGRSRTGRVRQPPRRAPFRDGGRGGTTTRQR